MNRIKAFFGGLFDTKASEAYAGWAGIVMMILTKIPAAAPLLGVLNWLAENIFQLPDIEALIGVLITYAMMRMTKKAATAEPA